MINGLAHVNLTVPSGTLEQANEFYGTTLGLTPRPVPALQKGTLAWFDIGTSSQQVHVSFGPSSDFDKASSRHPCFRLESPEALVALRQRIWDHFVRGGDAAPRAADKPGGEVSGTSFCSCSCRAKAAGPSEARGPVLDEALPSDLPIYIPQGPKVWNIRSDSLRETTLGTGWSSVCRSYVGSSSAPSGQMAEQLHFAA